MFELTGRFASAKIFAELVDEASIAQVMSLLNQEFTEGSRIRMMPDIHAGAGCTIGTTMTVTDKICPNLVGVDIGCGMKVIELEATEDEVDLAELDRVIRAEVPSGFSKHAPGKGWYLPKKYGGFRCADHLDLENAERSLGTLGGGNHFIELNKDDEGHLYLVIHSGSRHLGLEVATFYQRTAHKQRTFIRESSMDLMVEGLKMCGRSHEIADAIAEYKKKHPACPEALAFVDGPLFEDYLHDMELAQRYARDNRQCIAAAIMHGMDWECKDGFTTVHNYIDMEAKILRKGAVSAKQGERLIIPMNMRDGSLICVGKGNPDWNYSAPHGAGRLWSRGKAKEAFTVEEFQKSMEGVFTTSVSQATLDECPMAYKPMESILSQIGDTVTVKKIIKPIYNFKASN